RHVHQKQTKANLLYVLPKPFIYPLLRFLARHVTVRTMQQQRKEDAGVSVLYNLKTLVMYGTGR
ncbi:MAG TPA: hypothetical protein D7I06_08055, partial [Candidatus Poseidoniales archaeon]